MSRRRRWLRRRQRQFGWLAAEIVAVISGSCALNPYGEPGPNRVDSFPTRGVD